MLPNINFEYFYTINGEPQYSLTEKYKKFPQHILIEVKKLNRKFKLKMKL